MLFEVCADEGDELFEYVYLSRAEGDAGWGCGGGEGGDSVCQLWV